MLTGVRLILPNDPVSEIPIPLELVEAVAIAAFKDAEGWQALEESVRQGWREVAEAAIRAADKARELRERSDIAAELIANDECEGDGG